MSDALSFEAYRLQRRFTALDGLRALASLGVLIHHADLNPLGRLHGYRGVWVFFVLSGFLITTLALREEADTGRVNLQAFLIRRIFRILPLYYLALTVYLIWGFVHTDPNGQRLRENVGSFLLYNSEFTVLHSAFRVPFAQSWSLGIEEKFYLLWPLVAFYLLSRSPRRITVTLGLIGVTAGLTIWSTTLAQMWGSYCDILLGCLLAQLLHERSTYGTLCWLGNRPVAFLLAGILVVATVSPGTGTQIGECGYACVAALVIGSVVVNPIGPASLLTHPWLTRMGACSYGLYLTHPLVLDALRIGIPSIPAGYVRNFVLLSLTLLINLPLCWWVNAHVEQPAISFGKRFTGRITGAAPARKSALSIR